MQVDTSALLSLPPAEKLKIVELLWDDLGRSDEPIPLPEWVVEESCRRRDELIADPSSGRDHDSVWNSVNGRKQ